MRHRRVATIGAATAVLSVLLAGCSSGGSDTAASPTSCEPAGKPVTLEYWNYVPGMQKVIDVWNKENPDIQVKMKNIATDSAQQITNAVKANKAPDLAQVGYDTLPQFRSEGYLEDVSACSSTKTAKSKFIDWTWAQTSFNNQGVYAYPQDIGPMVMYYRADLFQKYHVPVPTTWAQYRTAAQQLKAADPNLDITAFDPSNSWSFSGLLWQRGGNEYSYKDGKWVVSIDNPNARQVADYWQSLINDGTVRTDLKNGSTALMNAYSKGELATMIGSAWSYTSLRDNVPDQSGDWRVAPLPQWSAGEHSSGNWGGSTVAFITGGKHPYEATKFAEWLDTDPQALSMLNNLGGLYPAAKAGADLPAFKAGTPYFGGQNIYDVFNQAADDVDSDWQWGPTQVTAYSSLGDAMTKAVNDGTPLSGALSVAQSKVIQSMQSQDIPVASN